MATRQEMRNQIVLLQRRINDAEGASLAFDSITRSLGHSLTIEYDDGL